MYCISCGTKNPEYAGFCYKCGTKLVNNGPEQTAQPTNKTAENSATPSSNNDVVKAEDLADKPRPAPTIAASSAQPQPIKTESLPPTVNPNQAAPVVNNQTVRAANPFAGPPPNQNTTASPFPANPNQPPTFNPYTVNGANPNARPVPPPNGYPYPTNQPPVNNPTGQFPPVNYPPNPNAQFGRPPTGAYPAVPPVQQPPLNSPTGGFPPVPQRPVNTPTGSFVPPARPQTTNPTGGFPTVPPAPQPPVNNPTGQFRPMNNPTGSVTIPADANTQSEANAVANAQNKPNSTGQWPNVSNPTAANNAPAPVNTANPYAQVPSVPPTNPTPSWPGVNPNAAPGSFNQPPTNPYGYNFVPPLPPRNAIAPNGLPYAVVDNPNRFFKYKNKDGKQVYAAYAEPRLRIIAAIVDTIVVLFPFVIVLIVYMVSLSQAVIDKINTASESGDASVINQYFPHWLTLVVAVAYLAYCTLLTAANGQTIGKRVTRLKVITLSGTTPDFRTSLLRNLFGFGLVLGNYIAYYDGFASFLGQVLSAAIAMGFLFIIFDPKRQGWHDKLANTLVVRSRELVEGRDFPAKGQQS